MKPQSPNSDTSSAVREAQRASTKGLRRRTLSQIASDRTNQIVFAVTVFSVAVGYSVLLPFDYTQRVSFANWHYLDAGLFAFALAFALAIGFVFTLQVHAMRSVIRQRASALTGFAALAGLLPSFLCCSPIVPTLVGLFGASTATTYQATGTVQYFFATRQSLILSTSLVLVLLAGLWSFRRVVRSSCLSSVSCVTTRVETDLVRDGRMK